MSVESLPSDIILDILSRVPTEFVSECKLVCKKWLTLIQESGTHFTNLHFSRQLKHLYGGDGDNDNNIAAKVEESLYFACCIEDVCAAPLLFYGGHIGARVSFDEQYSYGKKLKRINNPPLPINRLLLNFVGSCNGLMCINIQHQLTIDPIYIFNPVTREYVYLPKLVIKKEDVDPTDPDRIEGGVVRMIDCISSGFGYVSSTNEYKIVRINYPNFFGEGYVEVYTLGSGCGWRSKGTTSMALFRSVAGTYANNAIYWMTDKNVVAFDLVEEDFRLLPWPPGMINRCRKAEIHGLVTLGGHLCLYVDTSRMEIWSLKKRGNVSSCTQETWSLDFDIDYEAAVGGSRYWLFEPIVLTKKEEIIFVYDETALYCYDVKTDTLKLISDSDEASVEYFVALKAISHVNTFASLEAIGEKSKRYMLGDTWETC